MDEQYGAGRSPELTVSGRDAISDDLKLPSGLTGEVRKKFISCSAIIPTRNRPADLRLTVQTLLDQTILPAEVIVIDQSQGPESQSAVEDEFRKAGERMAAVPRLKYILDASIAGVSAARNRAMELADGAIWLFLDDDIIMEPDFLEELQNVYDDNPKVHGVSGVITNYPPPQWLPRTWMTLFSRGPFLEKRLPIYWKADSLRNAGLFPVAGFSGGLMSFRADVARAGRFDTRIGDGEDVDFCLNLGIKANLVIAPRVRLKHMSSPIGRSNDLWLGKLAATQGFLYQKNWSRQPSNKIYLAWFCVGLWSASLISSVRRGSWGPITTTFSCLRKGIEKAKSDVKDGSLGHQG